MKPAQADGSRPRPSFACPSPSRALTERQAPWLSTRKLTANLGNASFGQPQSVALWLAGAALGLAWGV